MALSCPTTFTVVKYIVPSCRYDEAPRRVILLSVSYLLGRLNHIDSHRGDDLVPTGAARVPAHPHRLLSTLLCRIVAARWS